VIGNPPYVREEQIAPFKPFLAAAFPETYDGVADRRASAAPLAGV